MIEAMTSLATVTAALEHLAPLRLAAEWDSVGLLVGSRRERIGRVLACLTLSAELMSGLGAPDLTAIPIGDFTRSTRLSATTLPCLIKSPSA